MASDEPVWRDDLARGKPGAYRVSGNEVSCIVCTGNQFTVRQASLNPFWYAYVWFVLWIRAAEMVTCTGCGHIHWFKRTD